MTEQLEQLLVCDSLSDTDVNLIERCLDVGYGGMPERDRARIRQLLNRSTAATVPGSALARYRLRRAASAGAAHIGRPAHRPQRTQPTKTRKSTHKTRTP